MLKTQQLAALIILMVELGVSLIMMIFYCRRVYKLSILASNLVEKCQFAMVFKICVIALYMCLEVLDIILTYTKPDYWFYDSRWMTFVNVGPILNMGMQIFIITREYKKKSSPVMWHNIYWSFLVVINGAIMWCIINFDQALLDTLVPIMQIVFLLILIGYSLIIEKKSFLSVNEIFDKEILLTDSSRAEQPLPTDKIYLEFNKQINLQVTKQGVIYTFQIAVYIGTHLHIINKTDRELEQLESDMKKLYPNALQVRIGDKALQTGGNQNWLAFGEQKADVFEKYLLRLAQSFYFYTQVLLEFLKVDSKYRQMLKELNKRRASIFSQTLNDSCHPHLGVKKFFNVKYSKNKISIDNPQILSLNIDRNLKQITEIHQRLLTSMKLKEPILVNNTDEEILEFVDKIANSKLFWNEFSAWVDINQSMKAHIFNLFDLWYEGFNSTRVDATGHQISMDEQGKTPTFYLFSLSKDIGGTQQLALRKVIKKRFKDFVRLDRDVRMYYKQNPSTHAQGIPTLPPKISPFGSKTSAKSREIYLQTYLVQLLALPQINNCIKVLEFLAATENRVQTLFRSNSKEKSVKVTVQELQMLQKEALDIEDLCVSKII